MILSTKTAPANSIVLVSDERGGKIPETMSASLIASTTSCIAIGCKSETDGETELTLGPGNEVDPHVAPAFQGVLDTPDRKVVLRSVLGNTLLEIGVPRAETFVRVWVNDSEEPDRVIVGVD